MVVGVEDEQDAGGALFLPAGELRWIDPTRASTDPLFVSDAGVGLGGSPAVVGQSIYSIGPAGLVCVRAAEPEAAGEDSP